MAWLTATQACAANRQVILAPPTTRISYTVFALGVLPISADFQRFGGAVTLDPAHPGACRINVTVDIASLHMDDPDRQHEALGPDMLDSIHFPTMHFAGACAAQSITGALTLHGVTRRITLAMHRDGVQVICDGTLARRDYGILGMSGMVSPHVHIRLSVHLPP